LLTWPPMTPTSPPRRLWRRTFSVLTALAMGACGGSVSSTTGGGGSADGGLEHDAAHGHDGGRGTDAGSDASPPPPLDSGSKLPLNHRPNDSECQAPAPAGECGETGLPQSCADDDACTTGTNGRCIADGPIAGCHCTYDTCSQDTDCPTAQLCVCHGSALSDGAGNTCMPGNCRVDSDCGADGYCSPTASANGCGEVVGYYCHTAADSCVNDTDCQGGLPSECIWVDTDSRWECEQGGECA